MEGILLVLLGLSTTGRFITKWQYDRRDNPLFGTLTWWSSQMHRFGGSIGTILVGLGHWLPVGNLGWILCGIAMVSGVKTPCRIRLINTAQPLWIIRNMLFVAAGIASISYGLGYWR